MVCFWLKYFEHYPFQPSGNVPPCVLVKWWRRKKVWSRYNHDCRVSLWLLLGHWPTSDSRHFWTYQMISEHLQWISIKNKWQKSNWEVKFGHSTRLTCILRSSLILLWSGWIQRILRLIPFTVVRMFWSGWSSMCVAGDRFLLILRNYRNW